jgi:hypothetical protein
MFAGRRHSSFNALTAAVIRSVSAFKIPFGNHGRRREPERLKQTKHLSCTAG